MKVTVRTHIVHKRKSLHTIYSSITSNVYANDDLLEPIPNKVFEVKLRTFPLQDTSLGNITFFVIICDVFTPDPALALNLLGDILENLMLQGAALVKFFSILDRVVKLLHWTCLEHLIHTTLAPHVICVLKSLHAPTIGVPSGAWHRIGVDRCWEHRDRSTYLFVKFVKNAVLPDVNGSGGREENEGEEDERVHSHRK